MPSPLELLLAAALLVALILVFVLNRRLGELRGTPDAGGSGQGQDPGQDPGQGPVPRPSNPRQEVEVHVETVGAALRLRVEPWVVYVENRKPLRWVLHTGNTDARMRIEAKDAQRWPFPGLPPKETVEPGAPFEAGVVRGDVASSWAYSIIVQVDGQIIDIDPEIFICY